MGNKIAGAQKTEMSISADGDFGGMKKTEIPSKSRRVGRYGVDTSEFPDDAKLAEVAPLYKTDERKPQYEKLQTREHHTINVEGSRNEHTYTGIVVKMCS